MYTGMHEQIKGATVGWGEYIHVYACSIYLNVEHTCWLPC